MNLERALEAASVVGGDVCRLVEGEGTYTGGVPESRRKRRRPLGQTHRGETAMFRSRERLAGLVAMTAALCIIGCDRGAAGTRAAPTADQALIANALSAAPEYIARRATVMVRGSDGQMRTLRPGTGGYTCMPDNPNMPGNMPMCMDAAGRAWSQALRNREVPPPDGPVSVAYMLQGSAFPSLDDPFAREPAAGEKWQQTGPMLMIMNVRGQLRGHPVQDPNPGAPFVMYAGTPYEHLMIPVGAAGGQ